MGYSTCLLVAECYFWDRILLSASLMFFIKLSHPMYSNWLWFSMCLLILLIFESISLFLLIFPYLFCIFLYLSLSSSQLYNYLACALCSPFAWDVSLIILALLNPCQYLSVAMFIFFLLLFLSFSHICYVSSFFPSLMSTTRWCLPVDRKPESVQRVHIAGTAAKPEPVGAYGLYLHTGRHIP